MSQITKTISKGVFEKLNIAKEELDLSKKEVLLESTQEKKTLSEIYNHNQKRTSICSEDYNIHEFISDHQSIIRQLISDNTHKKVQDMIIELTRWWEESFKEIEILEQQAQDQEKTIQDLKTKTEQLTKDNQQYQKEQDILQPALDHIISSSTYIFNKAKTLKDKDELDNEIKIFKESLQHYKSQIYRKVAEKKPKKETPPPPQQITIEEADKFLENDDEEDSDE